MIPSPNREHPLLIEIGNSRNWAKAEPVSKGWSTDHKFHIKEDTGRELLLRISEGDEFSRKKLEYERIRKISELGIFMSMPIGFGLCCNEKYVYMLLTWIAGKDAEEELHGMDKTEQYRLGIQAGNTLKTIHSVRGFLENETWDHRYRGKIDRVIGRYCGCPVKLRYERDVFDFIRSNLRYLEGREVRLQHGDYHVGSFIITENNQLGIIDFNRSNYGDPWEEYDRYVFTWRVSVPFAIGQIDGYFNHDVPESFFKLMALYNAANMLASIPWAIPFGSSDVQAMIENCDRVFECYDGFQSYIPKWYRQRETQ